MNGILPNGNHHLSHANNQCPELRLHLQPGKNGALTKRVSVLIGNHQPIGVAQIKRVSILDCDRRAHGSDILMAMKNENLIYKDTKISSGCDGLHLFVISATRLDLL